MPTGYFKLVFRPARDSEPARLIGFLMPHSFENLNMAADFFDNVSPEDAFWFFVSTPSLIEEASGMAFPGIPDSMKDTWGDDFFFEHDEGRNIRSGSCGEGTPQGLVESSTKEERIAACIDHLP